MEYRKQQAVVICIAALIGGVLIQKVVKHEAAVLGISTLEIALMSLAVGRAVSRAKLN